MTRRGLGIGAAGALVAATAARAQPRGIDEQGFVGIGGIDQWIGIRGADRRAPVILFLHGGPAEAQSPFRSDFAAWEQHFVVVQWDQRGAGRTFGRNGATTPGMTLERMAADVAEVAEHARARLGTGRVILVGHSWGTILGVAAMRARPEMVSAYVGTGQYVDWPHSVAGQASYTLRAARAAHDQAAIDALTRLGDPPPADWGAAAIVRRWFNRYMPASDQAYLARQRTFIGDPAHPNPGEAADWVAGGRFSGAQLLPSLLAANIRALPGPMPVRFHVIQGRDDAVTPTAAVADYMREVRAPASSFDVIDGGHFAFATNPQGFVRALRRRVGRL